MGGDTQPVIANEGVYVGEGLPSVPLKVAKRIGAGEFIDMEELLPEVLMPKEKGEPEAKRRSGKRVTDIFTWLQCFGVFVSVHGAQCPGLIPELMAYMSLIIRVSQEYAGMAWWNYDVLFRRHAALKQDNKWSVINTTLYARCFTGAPRNPMRCEMCLATTHETRDCDQWMLLEPSLESRIENMERRMRQVPPPPQLVPRGGIRYLGEVCMKWNKKECSFPYCRHTHVCRMCGGMHPATRCPRRSRLFPGHPPAADLQNGRTPGRQ